MRRSVGEKQLAADLRQRTPACLYSAQLPSLCSRSVTAASRHDLTTDGDRLEDIRRTVPVPACCLPASRPVGRSADCSLHGRSLRPTPNSSAQPNERATDQSLQSCVALRNVVYDSRDTYDTDRLMTCANVNVNGPA